MAGFLSVRPQDWAEPQPAAGPYVLLLSDASRLFGVAADGTGTEITASGFTGGPSWLDCPPGQASVVYASWGPTGFARSDDGGQTWTSLTPPSGTPLLPIAAGSASVVYVIASSGGPPYDLYQSTDSGASWTSIDTPTGFRDSIDEALWANATGAWWPNALYDAAPGFYTATLSTGRRTTAAGSGAQFNAAPDTDVDNYIFRLAPAQDGSDAALVINDNSSIPANILLYLLTGTSASDVTPPSGIGTPRSADYGASYMLTVMYDGANGEIWRSTDSGSSWTRVEGPTVDLLGAVKINASDPTKAYAVGLNSKVWMSADSGVTWTLHTVAALGGDSYLLMEVLG